MGSGRGKARRAQGTIAAAPLRPTPKTHPVRFDFGAAAGNYSHKDTWTDDDAHYHCDDGPALIWYDRHNDHVREEYWVHGEQHREDGPAIIEHHIDGSRKEEWRFHHKRHRDDGPYLVEYDKDGKVAAEEWRHHDGLLNDEQIKEIRSGGVAARAAEAQRLIDETLERVEF